MSNEPEARPTLLPPTVVVIAALAGGLPFVVALAENLTTVLTTLYLRVLPRTLCLLTVVIFFLVTVRVALVGRWRTDWASTVPAALTVPLPGLYGVQSDVQR